MEEKRKRWRQEGRERRRVDLSDSDGLDGDGVCGRQTCVMAARRPATCYPCPCGTSAPGGRAGLELQSA